MRRIITIRRAAALCVSLVLSVCLLSNTGGGDTAIMGHADNADNSRLSQLEEEQKKLDEEIAVAEQQLQDANDNVEALKIKCSTLEGQIKNYKTQAGKIELQMAEIDKQLRESRRNLEAQSKAIDSSRSDFEKRIRAMYVAGAIDSYSNVLLNADDFYDVLMRLELVKRVADHDNEQLNSLMEEKRQLEETQKSIEENSKKLKEVADNYIKKQKELSDKQEQLIKLKEQAQEKADKLNDNKLQLEEQSKKAAEEYSKVSSKAAETTTASESEKQTSASKQTETGAQTKVSQTTKKPKSSTVSQSQTKAPQTTKAPAKTTTKAPEKTTAAQTTVQPAPKPDPQPIPPSSDRDQKIEKVLSYAKSNVGGAYVWAGENFRATDCSGLVLLSYRQIGVSLPHLASSQASYGTSVSYENMSEGDLIFFGYGSYSSIYHVAIYIGNGLMVHAESTETGIVISDVASFSMYNSITAIKRII